MLLIVGVNVQVTYRGNSAGQACLPTWRGRRLSEEEKATRHSVQAVVVQACGFLKVCCCGDPNMASTDFAKLTQDERAEIKEHFYEVSAFPVRLCAA